MDTSADHICFNQIEDILEDKDTIALVSIFASDVLPSLLSTLQSSIMIKQTSRHAIQNFVFEYWMAPHWQIEAKCSFYPLQIWFVNHRNYRMAVVRVRAKSVITNSPTLVAVAALLVPWLSCSWWSEARYINMNIQVEPSRVKSGAVWGTQRRLQLTSK